MIKLPPVVLGFEVDTFDVTEESKPSKVARLEINEEPPPPPALYLPDLSFPVPLPPPPPMYVESPSLGTVPFSYMSNFVDRISTKPNYSSSICVFLFKVCSFLCSSKLKHTISYFLDLLGTMHFLS